MATIIQERVERVAEKGLSEGAHNPNGAWCAMEAVAYFTGEPWSDHPECVCPVIGAFLRSWNDNLNDDERNKFITVPLLLKTVGTRGSDTLAERRSLMAADWLVRTHTPAWLRLAGLTAQADALSSLPEITAMAQVPSIREPIEAARRDAEKAWDAAWAAAGAAARAAAGAAAWDAAWDAAGAAAWDAAWAAAWDAAWDAAWAAAGAAARAAAWDAARDAAGDAAWAAAGAAAWDAARDAARDAAGDAAWDAARAAARAKLAPTKAELQASAGELIERMCALTDPAA